MAPTAPPKPRGHLGRLVHEPVRLAPGPRLDRLQNRFLSAPPVWRELLLIVVFYTAYSLVRLVLNGGGTTVAFEHARQIMSFERALGIDIELDLNQALLEAPWLARAANYFYATAHFAVTLAVVVWLYRFRPQHYRWLRTALIVATAMALIGFWLYPLAPPRFLPGDGFVDPVQALNSWGLYSGKSAATMTNQYAAMPSMHAGWALWCGYALVRYAGRRWIRVLGAIYPLVTVLVIIATANHYVVDAVVGMTLVVGALALSRALYLSSRPAPCRRRPPSRPAARRRLAVPAAAPPAMPDAAAARTM